MNTSGKRRAMTGSIHRIREFELEKVNLVEEFDILQIVGEGWFGKILLVEHRATDTEMVLKALPKPYVSIRDFYREFHYGLHLSAHKNIVTTYDVAFETAGFYVFSQEYAPLGDLTSNLLDTGIGELHTKRVAKQLGSALEHIHVRELVHRDVKLDNILIFKSDFSRIKLCDFGETRKINSVVRRRNEWLPYSPPEVLRTPVDNSYKAQIIHDIWQFGIVIFICLTGCLPWQKAAMDDPRYYSYYNWYNSSNPLKRPPKLFKMVSSKAQKMFKRFMEPRPEKRANNLIDFLRFMDDRWMAKGYTDRIPGGDIDELCPSMYSFHSDVNEKNKLLKYFLDHGIETTVDRQAKKQRIRDWIESSVITEETEEEEDNISMAQSCSRTSISDLDHAIECENNTRNHPIEAKYQKTSLRFADEKHINPRTGEVVEGVKTNHDSMLSYDVQNLEPVVGVNFVKRSSNREESVSQSSAKDSAYGSLDFRVSAPTVTSQETSRHGAHETTYNQMRVMPDTSNRTTSTSVPLLMSGSPSRSLSSSSIHQNRSPMLGNHQRFQNQNFNGGSFKGSPSTSRDTMSSTTRLQGSTMTLTSANGNGSNQTISQIPPNINGTNPRMAQMSSNLTSSDPRMNLISSNMISNDPRTTQTLFNNLNGDSSRITNFDSSDPGIIEMSSYPNRSSPRTQMSSNVNANNPRITQTSSNLNRSDPRISQNGYRLEESNHYPSYKSLKETAYDLTNMKNAMSREDLDAKESQTPMVSESPYTSMMNIVQGQMSLNPYGSKLNLGQNIVNVSVTPFNR